jgi:hypothetical protein
MGSVPTPTPIWVEAVEKRQATTHATFAATHGLEFADYQAEAEARLAAWVAAAEIRVRIRPAHVLAFLRDGRYKTQFETGHSAGYFDPAIRSRLEEMMLGVPHETPDELRPVYGYLSGSREAGPVAAYGRVVLHLEPEVRRRSTFTVGDTLDQTEAAKLPFFAPTPVDSPSLISVNAEKDVLAASDFASLADAGHRYAEVQIYGQVRTRDVASVTFTRGVAPDGATRAQLCAVGIPFRTRPGDAP